MPGTAPADDIPAGPRSYVTEQQPSPVARLYSLEAKRRGLPGDQPPSAGAIDDDARQSAAWWERAMAGAGLSLTDPHTAEVQRATLAALAILIRGAVTEWENNPDTGIPPLVAERLTDLLHSGVTAAKYINQATG